MPGIVLSTLHAFTHLLLSISCVVDQCCPTEPYDDILFRALQCVATSCT